MKRLQVDPPETAEEVQERAFNVILQEHRDLRKFLEHYVQESTRAFESDRRLVARAQGLLRVIPKRMED